MQSSPVIQKIWVRIYIRLLYIYQPSDASPCLYYLFGLLDKQGRNRPYTRIKMEKRREKKRWHKKKIQKDDTKRWHNNMTQKHHTKILDKNMTQKHDTKTWHKKHYTKTWHKNMTQKHDTKRRHKKIIQKALPSVSSKQSIWLIVILRIKKG